MTIESRTPLLSAGQVIHGCRVERFLGRGGMAEVFLATHLALQRWVALKILPPGRVSPESIERFLREAQLAARISHPNVIVIHDVGEEKGLHFIVMQYVDGLDLVHLLKAHGGPLPWWRAVRLMVYAAKGLHAVHTRGLIHRDVKPGNIMLTNDSHVLLMDFGLVREQWELGATTHVAGTPAYMSPEQARGDLLDRRTDVYSLGSTLYCLLTGHAPFEGTVAEVLAQIRSCAAPVPLEHWNPRVPPPVAQLVARAMAPYPQARFATAAAMARELKGLLADKPMVAKSAPPPAAPSAAAPTATEEPDPQQNSAEHEAMLARLEALDVSPLESTSHESPSRSWLKGAAALLAFALLGALWFFLASPRGEDLQLHRPPQIRDGMVYVARGKVHLGDDPQRLRRFFTPYLNESQIEQALEALAREEVRTADVPGFWIDQYEVTNAQYAKFVKATGRSTPQLWKGADPPADREDHPVVGIAYADAEAYARWAGKELPTREQWVRACRADTHCLFPWGDSYDSARTNVADNPKFPSTSPVTATQRDVSPFQVYNLAGNACEFIRGTFSHAGVQWRASKGSHFGRHPGGFLWAISSAQLLWQDGLLDSGLGFRCVREEP